MTITQINVVLIRNIESLESNPTLALCLFMLISEVDSSFSYFIRWPVKNVTISQNENYSHENPISI